MNESSYLELAVALLGGGALATVINRLLTRKIDGATVLEIEQRTQQIAVDTAREQIEIMRSVTQEMRNSYELRIKEFVDDKIQDSAKINTLTKDQQDLQVRVAKLEERERHMLTRAATHEAWSRLAYMTLIRADPEYPAPPALVLTDPDHPDEEAWIPNPPQS